MYTELRNAGLYKAERSLICLHVSNLDTSTTLVKPIWHDADEMT